MNNISNFEWTLTHLSAAAETIYGLVQSACSSILTEQIVNLASFSVSGLTSQCRQILESGPNHILDRVGVERVVRFLVTGNDGVFAPCFNWRLSGLIQESFKSTYDKVTPFGKIATVAYSPEQGVTVVFRGLPGAPNRLTKMITPFLTNASAPIIQSPPITTVMGFPTKESWIEKVSSSVEYITGCMDEADAKAEAEAIAKAEVEAAAKAAADAARETVRDAFRAAAAKAAEATLERAAVAKAKAEYEAACKDAQAFVSYGKSHQKRQEDLKVVAFDCMMQLGQFGLVFTPSQIQDAIDLYNLVERFSGTA